MSWILQKRLTDKHNSKLKHIATHRSWLRTCNNDLLALAAYRGLESAATSGGVLFPAASAGAARNDDF
jgi:hypothetical protein